MFLPSFEVFGIKFNIKFLNIKRKLVAYLMREKQEM